MIGMIDMIGMIGMICTILIIIQIIIIETYYITTLIKKHNYLNMANFFNEVDSGKDPNPDTDYQYAKYILGPKKMGMGSSWTDITNNFHGLASYVQLLVEGDGSAVASSAGGRPLGNKFFLRTAGKCKSVDSGKETERYMFVSNIPDGDIPFLSGAIGADFTELEGLIPGMLSNLNVLDPSKIFKAFGEATTPDCQQITMQTVDVNNNTDTETHYVSLDDISMMNPCLFPNKKNPVSKKDCVETFTNMSESLDSGHVAPIYDGETHSVMKSSPLQLNDPLRKVYLVALAGLVTYLTFRLASKNKLM